MMVKHLFELKLDRPERIPKEKRKEVNAWLKEVRDALEKEYRANAEMLLSRKLKNTLDLCKDIQKRKDLNPERKV